MTVVIGPDTPHAGDHWFCCPGCRDSFLAAA
jgi:xanthine dehydrogenase accessory factor